MRSERDRRGAPSRARAGLGLPALAPYLVALALAGVGRSVDASASPRLTVNINEKGVRYEISLPVRVFDELFPLRRENPDYITPAEREKAAALVEKSLRERNPVTVDGVRVEPVMESVEFAPGGTRDERLPEAISGIPGIPGIPGIEKRPAGKESGPEEKVRDERIRIAGGRVLATAFYGTRETPRQVSMVWELFPGPGSASPGKMYAGLAAFDDWQEILFSQLEPEYVWHALSGPTASPLAAAAPPEGRKVRVPVVTLVLLVAIPLFLVIARARKLAVRLRAIVAGVAAVLAVALVGVGTAEVELPWKAAIERPDEAQALEMFRTLHENIYSAFRYKTETDVYDVLARSVDGPLLDAIYNEIYQSLILRDQGGAVCKIDTVNVLESELAQPDHSAPRHKTAFGVKHRWRVRGSVHHWGHTHTRVNEYVAAYTVEPRGVRSRPRGAPSKIAWKITSAQVLEQKRVSDETDYGLEVKGTVPSRERAKSRPK